MFDGKATGKTRLGKNTCAVCYGVSPTQITVEVGGPIYSVRGLWRGLNAKFLITEPYSKVLAATTETDTWGNSLTVRQSEHASFTPSIDVLMSVDRNYYHKWISASASLEVIYPAYKDVGRFINESRNLTREMQLFVISDKEVEIIRTHSRWEDAVSENKDTFLVVVYIVLGGVFVIVGGFVFV